MPAIAKTSNGDLVAAARAILEESGDAGLTVLAIAGRTGIRGPSVYKHFPDRKAILRSLELLGFGELRVDLAHCEPTLEAFALAYLQFARSNRRLYALMFSGPGGDRDETELAARAAAAQPALGCLELILGDPQAARLRLQILMSFLHGVATLEADPPLRLGGDLAGVVSTGLSLIVPEAQGHSASGEPATSRPSRPGRRDWFDPNLL